MEFLFVPNKSVGKVEFGFTREEVRATITGFKRQFKKNIFSENFTDEFEYCHVFYDKNDKCNAIEFFNSCELVFESKNLFELNLFDFKKLFPDIVEEYGSYISNKFSIGVSFDDGKVESILVGYKDYYL